MKLKFNKVPSVMTGGKKYFYYNPTFKLWIAWNRGTKKWRTSNYNTALQEFDTVGKAKKFLEKSFDNG